ncbi:MAG TPA: 5'/3'-nucleotidase SurE [Candidatus Wallbacteria bacterium]|nr:5'/3'-nucleotidase SurE [Candidatus Wallbacteria bacterium]
MKILITNDDGIHAQGLHCLAETLAACHEVYVVAPDTEKSASSASITLRYPLKVKEFTPASQTAVKKFFHVNGMPADCAKIALGVILAENKPDMLISGINHGENMGVDIRYSGTVAAAFEGLFFAIPSLAVSTATFSSNPKYSTAAKFIFDNIEKLRARCHEFGTNCVLNINVPSVESSAIKGSKITRVNNFRYRDDYKAISDPSSFVHYWLSGHKEKIESDENTDLIAVQNGYVSITPLKIDMTDLKALETFKSL